MLKISIITAIAACAFAATAQPVPSTQSHYALVMEYRGDVFVLDHGLSVGDCVDALPRNDARKGLSFACERAEG